MKNVTGLKGNFHSIECDVTNEQKVIEAFDHIKKTFGGLHILINNAGCSRMGPIIGNNHAIVFKYYISLAYS